MVLNHLPLCNYVCVDVFVANIVSVQFYHWDYNFDVGGFLYTGRGSFGFFYALSASFIIPIS